MDAELNIKVLRRSFRLLNRWLRRSEPFKPLTCESEEFRVCKVNPNVNCKTRDAIYEIYVLVEKVAKGKQQAAWEKGCNELTIWDIRKKEGQVCISPAHDLNTPCNRASTFDTSLKNMPKCWDIETGNGSILHLWEESGIEHYGKVW